MADTRDQFHERESQVAPPVRSGEFTPGPYHWRQYANEPEDVENARKLGIEPVRMLTNEGQIAIMAGSKRVALIDCQTHFKRGQGYKTECAERDANATLLSAAPDMLAALKELLTGHDNLYVAHFGPGSDPLIDIAAKAARAAIAKASSLSRETGAAS